MIDENARLRAVTLLEKVITKKMTNWQLEDSWPESKDAPALNCIFRWIWTLYDDGKETPVIEKLSPDNREVFDRCLAFLKSDHEFPVKSVTPAESVLIRQGWGVEWRTDCTCPQDSDLWPFSQK